MDADTRRLVDKYRFSPGDMIIDSVSGERGILISRKRMIGDMYNPSPLFVWKIAWFPPTDPKSLASIWHPKEYPEQPASESNRNMLSLPWDEVVVH